MSVIRVIDMEFDKTPADGGVIEVGFCDLVSRNTDLSGNPCDWEVGDGYARLCNPGGPISPESQAIHHIDDADVAGEPNWKSLVPALLKRSEDDGVIAYASHGHEAEEQWMHPDWLGEKPLPMICTHKTALRVFGDRAPKHGNQVLRYWRRPAGLDPAKAQPPHRAFPDAYVTAFLLRDLLNDEGTTLEQLIEWTKQPALQVRCYLGEYRNDGQGTLWSQVRPDYLNWIVNVAGFHDKPDVRFTAQHWLEKHEIDQRLECEQEALNTQLRANGLPVDGEAEPNHFPDERQEEMPL